MREQLVLIGNGMAGMRCLEHLVKLAPHKYEITVYGKEPHPNYNRIMLSSVLAGEAELKDIVIQDRNWYDSNEIRLHTSTEVVAVHPLEKQLELQDGSRKDFDKLIMATGSDPFILPLPGVELEGVLTFRDISDCEAMVAAAKQYKKATVIGGGLLGLEAARGLLQLGMEVQVVHLHHYLMERQLDEPAAKLLQKELEEQGMDFLLQKQTKRMIGTDRVEGLEFVDGSRISTDLVVMAVGIRPNTGLAISAGIEVNRGIVVNDWLQTSQPHMYALGECAEHRGATYGLVAPLYEQGEVLAKRLAGVDTKPYEGSVVSTKLKVSGIHVFSAGRFADQPDSKSLRIQDDMAGIYKKVVFENGKVVGAVLYGDTSDSTRLFSLIRKREEVAGREREILFGESVNSGNAGDMQDQVAMMELDEIVCGCNGVSKGRILQAVQEEGCKSVGDIKSCTKASASCGGCQPLVEQLMAMALGQDQMETVPEGICGCTVHTREEIVDAIRAMELMSTREVMHVMGWKEPEGCSKCRPALNYYLGMIWPGIYQDEGESRFVNERNHANIQKDGTYSVVPRIYGGVTSPSELKRIAEIAEKYAVPMVKITGGQRIDLLGVQKENLPAMWSDLDMPSGYAYGKALRTVKTCVGSTFCRFGTQDAIQMGIELEKKYERLYTPAKVKMAVSGCPRNCAEATIKDFGIVAIDGGWEIYVAGNGGVKVRVSELLTKVKSGEEVMEWCGAFLQYYREQARYGERTAHWIERVGLDAIREVLSDQATRTVLVERIEHTLSHTVDPWKEMIESKEKAQTFMPQVHSVAKTEEGIR
ncbi:nitrite reductase large subunit NirB [Marinicrinis sediminis]|uniref:Nitrite reductase large subunit NirB n=1 Tax=Marinicrinis sediminis TaxID=1652465 RepID=A0ABW5R5P7_9BACL